jgi:protein gp37
MNKIGWCTETINCITGCLNNCEFCYARKMAYRLKGRFGYPADDPFRPTFHPDKLQDIYNLRGAHKRIFLDSMGDWFSEGVDPAWIEATLKAVGSKPEHTFLVLTKWPDRILDLDYPSNLWVGVSVTCQDDIWRLDSIVHDSILPIEQHLFISFEPLHGPIEANLSGIDWIIIGAESGNRKGKIKPALGWISSLIDNLKPYWCYGLKQEFPKEML